MPGPHCIWCSNTQVSPAPCSLARLLGSPAVQLGEDGLPTAAAPRPWYRCVSAWRVAPSQLPAQSPRPAAAMSLVACKAHVSNLLVRRFPCATKCLVRCSPNNPLGRLHSHFAAHPIRLRELSECPRPNSLGDDGLLCGQKGQGMNEISQGRFT